MSGRAATALALAMLLAGCRAGDPRYFPPRNGEPFAEAIVLDNHWHTALIFQPADLPHELRRQLGSAALRKYVAIGWGDEGFFRAEHITPALVLQALFNSRGSVLLVIGFDSEPEETFAGGVDIYRIPTSAASVERIAAFATASFKRDSENNIIDAGPGIDGGEFFTATGRYAFYHTCNQWTADGLAAGGMPVTGAYAGTAMNLALQVRQLPGTIKNGQTIPRPRGANAALCCFRSGTP